MGDTAPFAQDADGSGFFGDDFIEIASRLASHGSLEVVGIDLSECLLGRGVEQVELRPRHTHFRNDSSDAFFGKIASTVFQLLESSDRAGASLCGLSSVETERDACGFQRQHGLRDLFDG